LHDLKAIADQSRVANAAARSALRALRERIAGEVRLEWKVHGRDAHGRAVCFARTRRGGAHERCHRFPVAANGRCRQHGGLSDGSGTLRHGRRSRVLSAQALGRALAKDAAIFAALDRLS
jgi:hypothetical protein